MSNLLSTSLHKCEHCKFEFKKVYHNQKFCNNICKKEYYVKKDNEAWSKRTIDRSRKDSKKVFGSFFRKKYSISNKFRACRG